MKSIFTIICVITFPTLFSAQNELELINQEIDRLVSYKDLLTQKVKTYEDSALVIEQRIGELRTLLEKQKILDLSKKMTNTLGKGETLKLGIPFNVYVKDGDSFKIESLEPGRTSVVLLEVMSFPYIKVKYNKRLCYVDGMQIDLRNSKIFEDFNKAATYYYSYSQPFQGDRKEEVIPKQNSSSPTSSPSYDSSPTIHTGPRGGQFYYTKSGKKRYISQNKKN